MFCLVFDFTFRIRLHSVCELFALGILVFGKSCYSACWLVRRWGCFVVVWVGLMLVGLPRRN